MDYAKKLEQISFMENAWENALNQTEMYSLLKRHFHAPLPEGKTVKKAIVIGYDGCTCEMLNYLDRAQRGAVKHLLANGGHAAFSYAGGMPYPQDITQETSTAPGWCSMLTGTLAQDNKITDNGIIKALEPKTLLVELVEDKTLQSSAFYVSWGGHFVDDNATYLEEKRYIDEKGLKASFVCADSDEKTRENVLADITSDKCSDFIFCILEYTDENGHGYDYLPEKPEYMQAFLSAESDGMDFVEAITNRRSFAFEDWLILITSDHGGYQCGHGGPTLQERITFIVSNKEIL